MVTLVQGLAALADSGWGGAIGSSFAGGSQTSTIYHSFDGLHDTIHDGAGHTVATIDHSFDGLHDTVRDGSGHTIATVDHGFDGLHDTIHHTDPGHTGSGH